MYGAVNIDKTNGIRYGVIRSHAIAQAWSDNAKADYGPPWCPTCNDELTDKEMETEVCGGCGHDFNPFHAYGNVAIGYQYEGDGYEMADCLDSDVMVIKSPFYTFASLCSPCVPNAGNLDDAADFVETNHDMVSTPDEACFPKAYCAGHDWFDSGRAPYPVYGVVSNRECFPDSWYGR